MFPWIPLDLSRTPHWDPKDSHVPIPRILVTDRVLVPDRVLVTDRIVGGT